jgi:hypothetical protein
VAAVGRDTLNVAGLSRQKRRPSGFRPTLGSTVATGLVIVVALILLLVVNAKNYTTMLTDYRVVDPHTIVVGADGAPRGWARVTKVTETSSEVRITVDVLDWLPGPGTAYATRVEMTVGLA